MYTHNVWNEIDELAFHEKAIFLEACSRSQNEEPHGQLDIHQSNKLDLPSARYFLDDLALIAAGPGGATNVTAACLELSQSSGDIITVRVAKNEDFNPQARQRLSQITEIMNRVRQRDLSIVAAQDLCFDLIVVGCHSRISKQILGPTGLWNLVDQSRITSQDRIAKIDIQIKACPARLGIGGDYEYNKSSEIEEVEQLVANHWKEMRELINNWYITRDLEAIKRLARLAYDVRHSIAFRDLVSTQCQEQKRSSQILERIGKVAKFFRSAVSIIRVAGCATLRDKQIKVETVPSISRKINVLRDHSIESMRVRKPAITTKSRLQTDEIQRLLRRWRKYVVHAEMLLLTFYEEHPQIVLATNYIGISKRSCYLCANFIRFHNFFSVEGQHQQLYCLWTLPAEIKFGSQAQGANFVKALSDLQLLLTQRLDEVIMPQHRSLAFLKESVANFSRATILARAHSLENLSTVMESDECLTSNIVYTPPNPGGEPPPVQLARGEKSKLETGQERVKEEAKTEISCSPLIKVEEPSPPDLGAVEHLQTQLAASPGLGISSSSDLGKELSHIGKQSRSDRCRRAEHRERHNRRRKSKRSPATQRSDRHARKKKTSAHSRTQVPPQVPASTRRHPKIVSQKKQKIATVGCLSMLVACLKSAGRRMMIVGSHKLE